MMAKVLCSIGIVRHGSSQDNDFTKMLKGEKITCEILPVENQTMLLVSTKNPLADKEAVNEAELKDLTMMILCHRNLANHEITDKTLMDDIIIEVDWEGNVIWVWACNEHFHKFGFSNAAKNALFRDPNMAAGGADWIHINCLSILGPNKWYD